MNDDNQQVNFGFSKVHSKQKKNLVDQLFSNVSQKYDLMNDVISCGIHRIWKEEFCNMVLDLDSDVLDVAGGTGDIALKLYQKAKLQNRNICLTISDINQSMLDICEGRAIDQNILQNIQFVLADAEKMPFDDNSFDYCTMAFGIRNVSSIDNVLKEVYRVLRPTGKFLCLEFSHIENDLLKPFYDFYSFNVMPNIGKIIAGDYQSYQYLAESIRVFPNQEDFKTMIQNVGFTDVSYKNLTFGIVAIHSGYKT